MHARTVDRLPLAGLWRQGVEVVATRGPTVGEERIRELLRDDAAAFVVANIGEPLRWLSAADRFDTWKAELRPRLVPPAQSRFPLADFPDERCYVATEWSQPAGAVIVVFECHH